MRNAYIKPVINGLNIPIAVISRKFVEDRHFLSPLFLYTYVDRRAFNKLRSSFVVRAAAFFFIHLYLFFLNSSVSLFSYLEIVGIEPAANMASTTRGGRLEGKKAIITGAAG